VKGQKLAITLGKNNLNFRLQQGFYDWEDQHTREKRAEFEQEVQRNVELITQLKERLRSLEKENEDLGIENEELRQFSLDGYDIAKNVQALTAEREKLSVDLADKASTIRKLLDENDTLQGRLKDA